MQEPPISKYIEKGLCINHGDSLTQGHVVLAAGTDVGGRQIGVLCDLYAMTLFLNTSGHFIRLLVSLEVLMKDLVVVLAEPPERAASEAEQCKNFLVSMYAQQPRVTEVGIRKYTEAVDVLFSIFNDSIDGAWRHHYSIKPVADVDELRRKAAWACSRVFFRAVPQLPAVGKWCKLLPAASFYACATWWGLLADLSEAAFSKVLLKYEYDEAN
jgi:hypothetical protein